MKKLTLLVALTREGIFGFNSEALESYLDSYRKRGCPAVHHSETFRAAYRPAYRVIEDGFARLVPVIAAITDLLGKKERVIIGIDGQAASGKTVAAKRLSMLFDANIIQMDAFFLPPALRKKERYAEIGGNIHYERFEDEVIKGMKSGDPFSYKVFDCSVMDYNSETQVSPKRVEIVEGSYCMHPYFDDIFDIKVFSMVSEKEQKERILKRNGADMLEIFENLWIPMENEYFSHFSILERCDFLI